MAEVSKRQLAAYAAAVALVAVIGARYLKQAETERDAPRSAIGVRFERSSTRVFVYVAGAVRRPGVYRLPSSARLDLAVRRAGGPTRGADLEGVNLAARVSDGQQVVVPKREARGALTGAQAGAAGVETPISLNIATLEQLQELEGVGPVTAQKILDWRKEHGGFRSTEDLQQINGIGPKRFEALKDKVRV